MTPSETAHFLRQFNAWRRGDDEVQMQDPFEIGVAIDAAVGHLDKIERLRAIEAAAKNLVKMKGRHHTEIAYQRLVAELEKQSA